MKHSNVVEFLSDSLWLATDGHMEKVQIVAESILRGENKKLRGTYEASLGGNLSPLERDLKMGGVRIENGIGFVPITGTIMPKANMMMQFSGGTSAELLTTNIQHLTKNDSVHTILLEVDSNGGQVHALAPAAAAIREARESKRVYAIAEYNMNSAAYWLGSAAEKVFVTPTSKIGSIGVISMIQLASKEDQDRVEIIRSVPGKSAITPFEPLSEEGRKGITSDVMRLHASFIEAISLNRNISMEKANTLADGSVKMGDEAVQFGLADGVVQNSAELLAQIEAMETAEDRYTAMQSALTASDSIVAALNEQLELANAHIAEMTAAESARQAELQATAFEASVDAAIADGKIAPALKPDFLADLNDGSMTLSAFERMVGNISAGTTVPQEELDLKQDVDAKDPLAPANEVEAKMFAQFPDLAKKAKS